ncbi:MAG: prephenate dehydrogenase/arogenate dehydrogenase family protein [Thiotrichaceae bacterium]|nr:prephenate dehydrogenase/arogenate dehydrogenase family protein [Thiotrichaceae bacterium]PCI12305.1 MAG: prephenate dehydrogenase [Thiotrichales bacterium]
MTTHSFSSKRLTIIGVGLIGGSLARALHRANACDEIIGCGRDEAHLKRAVELGVIDRYEVDPAAAVSGADVVVLAVPLRAMATVLTQITPGLAVDVVITDVGSAKGCVVEEVRAVLGERLCDFVPGHPIAGTEQSGVEASFAELFDNRSVILTPIEETAPSKCARIRAMWESVGANVTEMAVLHHDEVLAATSHLPHLLAFSLVNTLASLDERKEIFDYAAGGFRDFTRIASSDPVMWRDICLENRDALLEVLAHFNHDLKQLEEAVRDNDGQAVVNVFTRAKTTRDRFCG